jgi:hypothetical protein
VDAARPRLPQVVEADSGTLGFGYPGAPAAITPPPASEIVSVG